jgi:hypothetical protein
VIAPIAARDVAAVTGAVLVLSAVDGLFRLITRPVASYRRRDRILAAQAAVVLLGQLAVWLGAFYFGYVLLIWPVTR